MEDTLQDCEELEFALIAGMMQRDDVLNLCINTMKPEYFRGAGIGALYQDIVNMAHEGELISVGTVANKLSKNAKAIQAIGQMPIVNSLEDIEKLYIQPVIKNYQRFVLQGTLTWALGDLTDGVDVDKVKDKLNEELYSLESRQNKSGPTNDGISQALTAIQSAMQHGKVVGVSTGFNSLDSILGGYGNTNLIILAGRPGMGKTSLAISAAQNIASNSTVLFSSLEMSTAELSMRRLSILSGISARDMRAGNVNPDQFKQLSGLKMSNNLWIDDQAGQTPEMILQRARRLKKEQGLGLIIVDYLQLMRTNEVGKSSGRYEMVTAISNKMKEIAKELNVPVLLLSQLSRAVEQREDKRPVLADLRESGAIEQDADAVMFVYRDEYYLERKEITQFDKEKDITYQERLARHQAQLEQSRGKAEVIVAKNRHGPIGKCVLNFDANTTAFKES